ncbi:DUF3182 family protein [Mesorhizobium sp. M1169]|uniref:DUF3182 family protein n=1 Tax=Mesorhizobium sp. M1169 TaxID=2957066 RepID=UPI0033371F66
MKSGVLEACWRIGGCSTAELAAMNVMRQGPDVQFVRASPVKAFGINCRPPANATVHFQERIPTSVPSRATRRLRGYHGGPLSDNHGSDRRTRKTGGRKPRSSMFEERAARRSSMAKSSWMRS